MKFHTDLIFDHLSRVISCIFLRFSPGWNHWILHSWPLRITDSVVIQVPALSERNYGSGLAQTLTDSTATSSCVLLLAHVISVTQILVNFDSAWASINSWVQLCGVLPSTKMRTGIAITHRWTTLLAKNYPTTVAPAEPLWVARHQTFRALASTPEAVSLSSMPRTCALRTMEEAADTLVGTPRELLFFPEISPSLREMNC